jgi:hypothetical protein
VLRWKSKRHGPVFLALDEIDPATPETRKKLATKVLFAAIRRYEDALEAMQWMDAAYPLLCRPTEDRSEEAAAEREAWKRLVRQFDDDFSNAELALATRIQNLYDDLAPVDKRAGTAPLGRFIERAVKVGRTTYALQYSADEYEPGTCIVAVVRDDVMFSLTEENEHGV